MTPAAARARRRVFGCILAVWVERSEREGIETNDSGKGNGNRRVYE